MSTLGAKRKMAKATDVCITEHELVVTLANARVLSVPLEWFPRLRAGTREQRANWRMIGGGEGIHWEELDEDISVAGLLAA